jgi:hypothetical protein
MAELVKDGEDANCCAWGNSSFHTHQSMNNGLTVEMLRRVERSSASVNSQLTNKYDTTMTKRTDSSNRTQVDGRWTKPRVAVGGLNVGGPTQTQHQLLKIASALSQSTSDVGRRSPLVSSASHRGYLAASDCANNNSPPRRQRHRHLKTPGRADASRRMCSNEAAISGRGTIGGGGGEPTLSTASGFRITSAGYDSRYATGANWTVAARFCRRDVTVDDEATDDVMAQAIAKCTAWLSTHCEYE